MIISNPVQHRGRPSGHRSRLRGGIGVLTAIITLAATAAGCSGTPSSSGGSGGGSATSNVTYTTIVGTISPGAPINPFNTKGVTFSGYNNEQLAWNKQNPTNFNDFWPALATSWEQSSDLSTVTLHLNPKAGWSDGTPVTAKDVVTSFAAGIVAGNSAGLNIGSVKAVDDHTVKITQFAKPYQQTFLYNVLNSLVVSNAVYGPLLPSNVWQLITDSQGSGAAAKTAADQITALQKKVTTFAPKKDVSAGPFAVTAVNPGEAVLAKNTHFFAADKVTPTKVIVRNESGNQQIIQYLTGGQLDSSPYIATSTATNNAILKAGNTMLKGVSYVEASLAFNQTYQPFNDVRVRQGMAYLLDRSAITKVGEPVSGVAVTDQAGMIQHALDAWLKPETKSKLNAYANDPSKTTQLWQQAGLKKGSDGKWQLADGKPFTINLESVSGFSDWIAGSNVVCSELNNFGVPCKVSISPDFATYQEQMAAGKYAMGWWLVALGPNPSVTYNRIYGAPYGYTLTGDKLTYKTGTTSGNWINGPKTVKLPDGTSVQPGPLTSSLNNMAADQMSPTVQKLILATNESVPVIGIWDYINVQFVNEKRFTNFPKSTDDNSGLLRLSPGVWMSMGYIQPKK